MPFEKTVNCVLSNSLNKIYNNLSPKNKYYNYNFLNAFNEAKSNVDKLIHGNDYFSYSKYFKKEQHSPPILKKRNTYFTYRRQKSKISSLSFNHNLQSRKETNLLTREYIPNKKTSLSPNNNKIKLTLHNNIQHFQIKTPTIINNNTTTKDKETSLFEKPYEKELILNLAKMNKQFISDDNKSNLTKDISPRNKLPLVMKIHDKNLQTLLIDNKSTKELRRKGDIINSPLQTAVFLNAFQQNKSNQNSPKYLYKKFINNALVDKVLQPNSKLKNIYSKCIFQIKNGEEIENYLFNKKLLEKIKKEKRDKHYFEKTQKMEDKLILDTSEREKNTKLKDLFNNQSDISKINEKNNKLNFQKKLQRLDVIPKISETLAFRNRVGYFNQFDYNYSNDDDFIFSNEFNKIKPVHNTLNVDDHIVKHNKYLNNNYFNNEKGVEQILETTEKERILLLKHIEDSQLKYKQQGYLTLKPKGYDFLIMNKRRNNHRKVNNNINNYTKKSFTHKKLSSLNINNTLYTKTFKKSNSMSFITSSNE